LPLFDKKRGANPENRAKRKALKESLVRLDAVFCARYDAESMWESAKSNARTYAVREVQNYPLFLPQSYWYTLFTCLQLSVAARDSRTTGPSPRQVSTHAKREHENEFVSAGARVRDARK
jgi:hypothetical protein